MTLGDRQDVVVGHVVVEEVAHRVDEDHPRPRQEGVGASRAPGAGRSPARTDARHAPEPLGEGLGIAVRATGLTLVHPRTGFHVASVHSILECSATGWDSRGFRCLPGSTFRPGPGGKGDLAARASVTGGLVQSHTASRPFGALREYAAGGSSSPDSNGAPRDDRTALRPSNVRIFASSRRASASMSEGATPFSRRSARHHAGGR